MTFVRSTNLFTSGSHGFHQSGFKFQKVAQYGVNSNSWVDLIFDKIFIHFMFILLGIAPA